MEQREFRRILLRQALLQKKAKAILIVLAVAMGASVVTVLMNLQADLRYRMNRELRDYGPNVILLPSSGPAGTFLNQKILDSSLNYPRSGSIHERSACIRPRAGSDPDRYHAESYPG